MKPEKRLARLYEQLDEPGRAMLMEFAEFLAARRTTPEETPLPEPLPIPRPENETVVRAIKRLRETYPMLDAAKLLHETSNVMTQHVMHGRPAVEVIEELEVVFSRHYRAFADKRKER